MAAMRRVRYCVAASLDGFIAGPDHEADWISVDPEIDFAALFAEFDTFLMGRRTYEQMQILGGGPAPGAATYVFSRTMGAVPGVTVVADRAEETVKELRAAPGKDIWLFGGGSLFRSLASTGLVDTVEVAVIPIVLGAGIPLIEAGPERVWLKLTAHRVYAASGIVSLEYNITRK